MRGLLACSLQYLPRAPRSNKMARWRFTPPPLVKRAAMRCALAAIPVQVWFMPRSNTKAILRLGMSFRTGKGRPPRIQGITRGRSKYVATPTQFAAVPNTVAVVSSADRLLSSDICAAHQANSLPKPFASFRRWIERGA